MGASLMVKVTGRLPFFATGLLLAACSATMPTKTITPTANPETSFEMIAPKDAPHYALQPGQSASLPRPVIGHFAPPQYPSRLAHAGMPPVTVKAQLGFDTSGHVQNTWILSNSYTGAGRELFADAVRQATARWVFTPLTFEETTGGGASAPVTVEGGAKPFSLWFSFHFTMVDGKPAVFTIKR